MDITPDGKRVVIAIYPPTALKARLQQYAASQSRSMGDVAMEFIEQGLDAVEAPQPQRRRSLL